MPAMKRSGLFSILLAATIGTAALAQTPTPAGDKSDEAALLALTKKIEEQNTKIDMLSQQILKLELQVSNIRPGVMIGEPTPSPGASSSAPEPSRPAQTGNTHVVAKGETLTSIAKMHKVSVEELKKFNRIENDRTWQIGQTIMIPTPGAAPGTSSSPTPASPNG